MKKIAIMVLTLAVMSCKGRTEKWFNGLADYKEVTSSSMQIEVLKMDTQRDTSLLNYKLRIYLDRSWVDKNQPNQTNEMNYQADSCFYILAGGVKCRPAFVQPVANGIKNCYEYLISFNADKQLKMKSLNLVYADKYIDGKTYTLDLNKH